MKKDIAYYWGGEDLQIDLGNRVDSRIKIILSVEFAVTIAMATVFFLRSFQVEQRYISFFLAAGAVVLYLMASYRFLSRIYYQEKIIITQDHFTLIVKTFLSSKRTSYDWKNIGTLHYVGKDFRNMALFGDQESYDYLNFSKQELLVNDIHHSGNLLFYYKGNGVRFARGIYSWHAEEIVRMIQLYTGSSLKLGAEWEYLMETSEWEE